MPPQEATDRPNKPAADAPAVEPSVTLAVVIGARPAAVQQHQVARRDDAARQRPCQIVGCEGVGAPAKDVARHLIEQDHRGERGVGIGQEMVGGQRAERIVPVACEVADRFVERCAAAVPVVDAVVVEPENKQPRRPVGGRRRDALRFVGHAALTGPTRS